MKTNFGPTGVHAGYTLETKGMVFQKKGKKILKQGKVFENLGKKCTKFEDVLEKARWLRALIEHDKLVE